MGYPGYDWREPARDRRKCSRPRNPLQYSSRLSDQGKNLAHARAEFYSLVGRRLGWKEASLPDTRSCPGRVSTRGETSFQLWRWRTDRGDALSPVQPSLDTLGALPVLRRRAANGTMCSLPTHPSERHDYNTAAHHFKHLHDLCLVWTPEIPWSPTV